MTPRRFALFAAAVLLAAAAGAAGPDVGDAVLAADAERIRAMVAGDADALGRIFAPDLVYVHANARPDSGSELIERIRSGRLRYRSMTPRDRSVRVDGGAAILRGKADFVAEADGTTHPLSVVFTAVYLQQGGRWRMAAYQSTQLPEPGAKEAPVSHRASGTFEVKMVPRKDEDGGTVGRFSLDKQYRGGLEATARGEMLAVGSGGPGSSGGYVALERVEGSLDGRKGGFALQHSGTMTRGAAQLSIAVVPDSGTGELAGLSGTLAIRIEDGKHFYDFDYALP